MDDGRCCCHSSIVNGKNLVNCFIPLWMLAFSVPEARNTSRSLVRVCMCVMDSSLFLELMRKESTCVICKREGFDPSELFIEVRVGGSYFQ